MLPPCGHSADTVRTQCAPCVEPIQNAQSTIHTIHMAQDRRFYSTKKLS